MFVEITFVPDYTFVYGIAMGPCLSSGRTTGTSAGVDVAGGGVAGAAPSVPNARRSASRKLSLFVLVAPDGGAGVCATEGVEAVRANDASAQKLFVSRMSGGDWGIF